jgi:hypothetical protein
MTFANDDVQVPEALRTDEFLLRPIRAADAELDYAAVMESKTFLRPWEQSGWPADDFTVEANREDLAKLEQRHADGASFTYTVMDPGETQSLGCVYIFPTTAPLYERAAISALDGAQWAAYEAAVYFWVRTSRLADGLDQRLLAALGAWFAQDWRIAHPLILTNEQVTQQVALFERSNLVLRFRLTFPNEPGTTLAYAYGPAVPAGG